MLPMPLLVEARFGEWNVITQEPAPPSDLSYASGVWHYARGLAFAAMGTLDQADREREELHKITRAIPTDRVLGTSNNAQKVSELAETVLTGEIASARGDRAEAIARLSDAVQMQDALIYDEPPIWYFPVREALGAELLAAGQATQAEAVYRSDLKVNPGNPRSLHGLAQSLRAEGKKHEAAKYENQFNSAWHYADAAPEPVRVHNAHTAGSGNED
jgi:tetratricopeptide (TPR) repeat protein